MISSVKLKKRIGHNLRNGSGILSQMRIRVLITDTSTLLDDMGQSAEDVMYTFMESWRNADFEAMLPLLTETLRRDEESGNLYERSDRDDNG